jgi:hypothetical protein
METSVGENQNERVRVRIPSIRVFLRCRHDTMPAALAPTAKGTLGITEEKRLQGLSMTSLDGRNEKLITEVDT